MAESRNLTWRRLMMLVAYDPSTGEVRDPVEVLIRLEREPLLRAVAQRLLAEPIDGDLATQVHDAIDGPSSFATEGLVALCPTCGLPGHMPSVGGGR